MEPGEDAEGGQGSGSPAAAPSAVPDGDAADVLAAIVRITRVIGAGGEMVTVFDAAADELAHLIPFDLCSVALLNPSGESFRVISHRGRIPPTVGGGDRPLVGTAGGWVITQARPLVYHVGPEDRFLDDDRRRAAGLRTAIYVPLLTDGAPVGVLAVGSLRPDAYSDRDLAVLGMVADQLGLAIAANNLRQDAERRAARAQFLAGLASRFDTSLGTTETLQAAIDGAATVLGDLNAILLRDEESGELTLRELGHPDPAVRDRARTAFAAAPPGEWEAALGAALAGQPLLAPDLVADAIGPRLREAIDRLGVATALVVPLIAGGEVIGVLASAHLTAGPTGVDRRFGPDDLTLARELAGHVAGAVVNARLHAATRRALDESEALRRIGQELASSIDQDQVLALVSTFTRLLLGADYAVVARDAGSPAVAAAGSSATASGEVQPAAAADLVRRTIADRRPVAIEGLPDARGLPREALRIDAVDGMRAGLGVPLVVGERVFGALVAAYRSPHRFQPTEIRLAESLAGQAAIVLENARLFDQAQKALALREEFLATAAHELRTPLTTLRGRTQLLQRRLGASGVLAEPDRDAFRVVLRQIDRLGRMVNDLLDVSRMDAETLPLRREAADLVSLAREAAAEANTHDPHQSIVVAVDGGGAGGLVGWWDPWRIQQVLTNLLNNAQRFSPPGAPIEVAIRRHGDEAWLAITDSGAGVAEEDLDRIFERFYRGDVWSRAGLGIGLAICRQVVASHGGRLWAASEGPGRGTTFTLTLPLGGVPGG